MSSALGFFGAGARYTTPTHRAIEAAFHREFGAAGRAHAASRDGWWWVEVPGQPHHRTFEVFISYATDGGESYEFTEI